ncbi:hypothetical protein BCR42DRAFT_469198 [Absidia repens]|uniref:Uncharacterized protein n=1 Tax=Absidia repens TaxID=90262 RepID=A0A1X2I8C0_9FUNG|nr:hypothetical protein BCR42DRAFT_469198 [Absidia repens]
MDPKQLINHNTKKAITAMNILSTFGVNRSGFNRLMATRIYQQFIRPMMEYGLAITTTTQQSLNKLESDNPPNPPAFAEFMEPTTDLPPESCAISPTHPP